MDWLNKKVKYTVTGFVGVVTGFAIYANGRECLLLEANDNTGRPIEWWIDTKFAEVIE